MKHTKTLSVEPEEREDTTQLYKRITQLEAEAENQKRQHLRVLNDYLTLRRLTHTEPHTYVTFGNDTTVRVDAIIAWNEETDWSNGVRTFIELTNGSVLTIEETADQVRDRLLDAYRATHQ